MSLCNLKVFSSSNQFLFHCGAGHSAMTIYETDICKTAAAAQVLYSTANHRGQVL